MTSRISDKFEELKAKGKKAFVPFIMAGDPDLETTIRLVPELERAGSSIVEIGIPFSDPVADGPTIQRAGMRSLRHGYRLADYLSAVRSIREVSTIPLLLFSYFNPLLQYGLENLARDSKKSGIDGMLVTDMTPEESTQYLACLGKYALDAVFMAAPTSSRERIERIARCSRGFIYVVSRAGVTGVRQSLAETVLATILRVREQSPLPVAVGFGISTPEQVRIIWEHADGAVVGSAIVAQMEEEENLQELPRHIGEFCRWLNGSEHD